MDDIFFWTRHDEYGFCSNYYKAPITIDGKVYQTTEHFYQSRKTLDPGERERIRNLPTPGEARYVGSRVELRWGWEDIKSGVMLVALRAKFAQHPDLAEELLATGDAVLHENAPWGSYWGYAGGRGLDMLGKLLMRVREELRKEASR